MGHNQLLRQQSSNKLTSTMQVEKTAIVVNNVSPLWVIPVARAWRDTFAISAARDT